MHNWAVRQLHSGGGGGDPQLERGQLPGEGWSGSWWLWMRWNFARGRTLLTMEEWKRHISPTTDWLKGNLPLTIHALKDWSLLLLKNSLLNRMLASYSHTLAGTVWSRSFQGSTSVLVSFSGSQMRGPGVKLRGQELLRSRCDCQTGVGRCAMMIMLIW